MTKRSTTNEWTTIREAAVTLQKTSTQVLRLMEIGDLEGRRDGNRWLVASRDVKKLQREERRDR